MPLLDHFEPPLSASRHWESFHATWANEIMAALNRKVLPPGYFAESQVHVGSRVEIDVASFEHEENGPASAENGGGVMVQTWAPPTTALVMPAVFPDEIEVHVISTVGGATLVAAIELVSPGNKDRPETRRAFCAKCASYLHMGLGLVVVDIATQRQANLRNELVQLLDQPDKFQFRPETALSAVAYRPIRRETADQIEMWLSPLALNHALPTMPLALRGGPTLPLDLEATYAEARLRSRL